MTIDIDAGNPTIAPLSASSQDAPSAAMHLPVKKPLTANKKFMRAILIGVLFVIVLVAFSVLQSIFVPEEAPQRAAGPPPIYSDLNPPLPGTAEATPPAYPSRPAPLSAPRPLQQPVAAPPMPPVPVAASPAPQSLAQALAPSVSATPDAAVTIAMDKRIQEAAPPSAEAAAELRALNQRLTGLERDVKTIMNIVQSLNASTPAQAPDMSAIVAEVKKLGADVRAQAASAAKAPKYMPIANPGTQLAAPPAELPINPRWVLRAVDSNNLYISDGLQGSPQLVKVNGSPLAGVGKIKSVHQEGGRYIAIGELARITSPTR